MSTPIEQNTTALEELLQIAESLPDISEGDIPDGYVRPTGTLNITENGEYDVTEKAGVVVAVEAPEPVLQSKTFDPVTYRQTMKPDAGYDGFSQVVLNPYKLQNKTVKPSDTEQVMSPDSGYHGLYEVTVSAVPTEEWVFTMEDDSTVTKKVAVME